MTTAEMTIIEPGQNVQTGKRKVDVSRGECRTDLAKECWNRPEDERFVSMEDLISHLKRRAETGAEWVDRLSNLTFLGNPHEDFLGVEGPNGPLALNHWSMGQMANQVGAPADYLRSLPANMAALNLQFSASKFGEQAKLYHDTETGQIRAVTSPSYGRITDLDVVERLRTIAQDSDVTWKVPGCMDWSTNEYDPHIPVTKQSTTLFAGDRDVAVFLCDDLDPIEVGTLDDGSPDVMFRGIFCRNSEVGAAKLEIMTMYLRGVCANRCLWGVEGFKHFEIVHHQAAPEKFKDEVLPFLNDMHGGDKQRIVNGVRAAKEPIPALRDATGDDRRVAQIDFLKSLNFSPRMAGEIIDHKAPGTATIETPWDVANQITSYAQTKPYHDQRLKLETIAGDIMDRATAAA